MRVFVILEVDIIYENRGSLHCATNGEIVRCFGPDDVCCLLLDGAGNAQGYPRQRGRDESDHFCGDFGGFTGRKRHILSNFGWNWA